MFKLDKVQSYNNTTCGDYLFDFSLNIDSTKLVASSSANSLLIYDYESLTPQKQFSAHLDTINCIECSKESPFLVYSASSDNSICLWDMRQSEKAAITYKIPDEAYTLSVSFADTLLTTAYASSILFFDLRKGGGGESPYRTHKQKLGEYSDMHSDFITQLEFNPSNQNILSSAAEDGLICIFDTSVAAQEDAVVSILNTECPIRKFGYFGTNNEGVYALSTVETASVWHYPSAQRITYCPSIRQELSMDYLVDCLYNPHHDSLLLIAGTHCGDGVVAAIEPNGVRVLSTLTGGHASTMRCCTTTNKPTLMSSSSASSFQFVTGGEDSRVCGWSSEPESSPNQIESGQNCGSGGSDGSSSSGSKNKNQISSSNHGSGRGGISTNRTLSNSGSKSQKSSSSSLRHKPY